jgi:tRNA (guanine-N7-)-methyltransferase
MSAQAGKRATEGFFGRRRGKAIRPHQADALAAGLERYRLDMGDEAPASPALLFAAPVSSVCMEIGFGGGERLLAEAAASPEVGFIGVEPFVNGLAKLMTRLEAVPLDNLRIHDDDALPVLDWLRPATLDRLDLFYPDPWPKKRHWKRRFVSPANLDRIARVLKPGGLFRFASDVESYVNWTLLRCAAHPAFDWLARDAADWERPYDGWPGTRYEAKAIREGRQPAYLRFVRRG